MNWIIDSNHVVHAGVCKAPAEPVLTYHPSTPVLTDRGTVALVEPKDYVEMAIHLARPDGHHGRFTGHLLIRACELCIPSGGRDD